MYTLTELLFENNGVAIHRGLRNSDHRPVVVKTLDPRRCRPRDLERLKNEYEIGRKLDIPAVAKPLALETLEGMPALITEDSGCESLCRLLRAPMGVEQFLPLAVAIAQAVAEVHGQNLVHKDLKPANILVNVKAGEVKIADFGIASRLPREPQAAQPLRLIEGSLPYISPEQTGRMNRGIDNRSDLYSLGVTFYEMLTGRLPFQATDPLEWVHCHIARSPSPPREVVPSVPEALSAIVMRLLSKVAEERYQSAAGLRHDLARCLAAWQSTSRIEPFPLGERDVAERFQTPQKLYGRANELSALLGAFERVVATGNPEFVLISGYSGVGKSALVHELYKPIFRQQGVLVSGKFEQYKRDIPYATIVQALRELVLEILAQSEDRIDSFRQRLRAALGVNGQLIVDMIPQVELIIGRQPPVPELPLAEAQNRFHMVFRHFIGVFARKEQPLAVFFDDLQWADSARLGLLEDLMTHPEARHLLVIGAYRDNEVTTSHPLVSSLDKVRQAGARVSNIVLRPLSREHLAALVSDTLHCPREDAAPLASLVHEKTAGNPFFAIQFLTALHEERLIEFDTRAGAFRWDSAKIREKGFTDNVVALMVGKLVRLPRSAQEALKLLACLGNTAEVAILAMVRGRSAEASHADLWEAVRAGLILRMDGTYKFLHDRVQEAAYSLIPTGERAAVHLEIGRLLSARTAPDELEERLFEIVNQLDLGAALITSREENERVAELNLVAGKRAKANAAYASALKYLAAGSALLAEESWVRRYELVFALELHRAECEYLTGELAAAEERLSTLWRRAANLVDLAAVTCARLNLYTTQDRTDRAVDAGLQFLRLIDIEWSPHPTAEEVQREYERMWQKLGGRPIEGLIDLPSLSDPRFRAAMDVLTMLAPPATFIDKNLSCIVIARMTIISLEHGNSDASCFAYSWLGTVLGPLFGDYATGFRFGKLGLDLLENRGLLRFKARVYLLFGKSINPWTRHLRTGLACLRRAFAAAQETGDLTYASYARNQSLTLLLAAGDPLGEVQREAEDALEFVRKAKFGHVVDSITGQLMLIRVLRGKTLDFASFDDADFDEGRFERHLESDPRLSIATCWYWIRKLEARFFAGDHASAVEAASKAERLLSTLPSCFEQAEYHFHGALARAAHLDTAPACERPRRLTEIVAHHETLEVWADNCPENFRNRAALVGAEIARIEGRHLEAEQLYEEAIRSARDNGFVHNEAVAYETAARFYRARGFELFADTYLREARARYLRWGADGKVLELDQRYPRLLETKPIAPTTTFAVRPEQLDLLSVTKASQTISNEIVLDKLIRTLLTVVLEQGGAQRACLILCQGKSLSIEAEAALEERGAMTSFPVTSPEDVSQRVPVSLVHYVHRTKERVILGDAAADAGKFSGDDYLARHKPKSVLCMPILRPTEVVHFLYLENNLLAGAFTPDRLVALELLATQAAISLDKALLHGKEQAARAAAEEAERRAAFLAEAGAILSESLDCEETFARLGRLCVRSLCDWCVIDILEGDEIQRISGAHEDAAKEPLLEELKQRYPPRMDSPHPAATVLRTGKALLLPELSIEDIRATCEDDAHTELIRALGTRTGLVVPLVARGQTLGVLSIASSAPGRRYGDADLALAQEVARRAAIAIDNARLYRKTQEAIRVRDEFLSVASHELNTPIASLTLALQSMSRSIQSGRLSDGQAVGKLVERALRQGARLARLNDDLLDVSRIHAERLTLEPEDVELGILTHDVVEQLTLDLARARCAVSVRDSAPIVGHWDRSRVEQIVINLLSNAIKFGAGKPIEISLCEEAGMARLAVTDHGIGIDPARQGRIFERFERAVSKNYGGLGLGLYISRTIAEAHGGTLRVQSEPDVGSTFTLELPCAGPTLTGRMS
ncbi:ATP-binding sensor histidine kinase [Polyangium sp. 15x6]|uniref:ATP-binding sensor histidine kinase n=1 Tax=Polyangium sp. 15x6 TaxID=3042687 RepID=UPI00249AF3AA|nr:ATP-binding sensor histidine kinase [Polyangium sp. 15x6]MDI3288690.1 trifunctional serine/threonine-protein kinase/ATP-binding protein/sensor histidine kinase [Polyangium sp. 15x6]